VRHEVPSWGGHPARRQRPQAGSLRHGGDTLEACATVALGAGGEAYLGWLRESVGD